MTNKQAAKDWIAKGGLSIYSDAVRVAAMRLLEDLRADEAWQAGLTVGAYEDAVHIFALASERREWDGKTQRERDAWRMKFDATCAALLELMNQSPAPIEESENAADLALALRIYREKIDFECEDQQALPKPGDPKASRAEFIHKFTQYQQYSANVVACIAMMLFDDESIDDRLIRKHAYRADSSEIKKIRPT